MTCKNNVEFQTEVIVMPIRLRKDSEVTFVVIKTDDPRFNSVNARDLHSALDVRRDFSNWIKGRIDQYGFVEGEDFMIVKGVHEANPAVADEIYLANFGEINSNDMGVATAHDGDSGVANEVYLAKSGKQDGTDMSAEIAHEVGSGIAGERSLPTSMERTLIDMNDDSVANVGNCC